MAIKKLSTDQTEQLMQILQARFEKNKHRHIGIEWSSVETKLKNNKLSGAALWSLNEMELSGGEPDVIEYIASTEEYVFYDCSAESPKGRRSICYDNQALEARKENKPENSAINKAKEMGITILNEQQYRLFQTLGQFDLKTSSWVLTPNEIRALGGAIFCDRRYDTIFRYHNGAESYYAARGFRGFLKV